MHHELPERLDLEWYREQAKALVRGFRAGDSAAVGRAEEALGARAETRFGLSDAQWVIAREHGHSSWASFKRWVETRGPEPPVGRIGRRPVAAYEARAAELAVAAAAGDEGALRRVRAHVPRLSEFAGGPLATADARLVVAREYGFPTWRDLAAAVERAVAEHEPRPGGKLGEAFDAMVAGDLERFRQLLDEEPELVHETYRGAAATLLEALTQPEQRHVDLAFARLLIERGSTLETPLDLAACFDHVELVRLLLAAGARVDDTGIWGITPLQSAIYHGQRDAADLLVAHGLSPDAFYVAAGAGVLDRLAAWFAPDRALRDEALAQRPNLADVGWPPLPPPRPDPRDALDEAFALSAFSGRLEAMAFLLDRGATVDGRVHGVPALHLAIIRGRLDVVRWLLDRGADVTARDAHHDRSAVGWAGGEGDAAVRDLVVAQARLLPLGDLALQLETAWAQWGARGEALLQSGRTYDGVRPVEVYATKRDGRYRFSDRGAAVEAAGAPPGWREAARAVEAAHDVNVARSGEVFLPRPSAAASAG